ncbi:MAG: type II toxin-antitoxin system PemK/MazF family toxin [Xenococcus sp. (in: cyanobacteria)]
MARKILRGSIYWADLNPTQGREQSGIRPVLVISHNEFNQNSQMAIVMAITSQKPKAGYPLTLDLTSAELPKQSWVKTTQIRAISLKRIRKELAQVSSTKMDKIIAGLNEVIS